MSVHSARTHQSTHQPAVGDEFSRSETAWLSDGRGWDRTKLRPDRPGSTEGDSADDLQGKDQEATEGATDRDQQKTTLRLDSRRTATSRDTQAMQDDDRANPRLARMLVGLAQERCAAQRPVSGEVWRCVAPHADGECVAALKHGWNAGNDKERLAIALALQKAPQICADLPADEIAKFQTRLASERMSWRDLAWADCETCEHGRGCF